MSNIVALADYHKDGWNVGKARCMACGHEWEAVAKTGTTWLECPSCTAEKGIYRHYVAPPNGHLHWVCNCGCDVFFITPEKTRCCNCGASQAFP